MGASWSNDDHYDDHHHHTVGVNKDLHQTTVNELDPILYSGEWWVFAHSANKLDDGCQRVTIDLSYDDITGNILSLRQCRCDGNVIKAYNEILCVPNVCEPGKMKSFCVKDCHMYDYCYYIHETDYDNYAIVGDPVSHNVWVLTRQESAECDAIEFFQQKVACYGYNPESLCAHESAVVRDIEPVVVRDVDPILVVQDIEPVVVRV